MTTNIKTIRFTSIMSGVLMLLTYLVSLNIRCGWFDFCWLPNDFLLAVIGGAFASMLVVLICELQKYWMVKKSTEDYIFSHTGHLFGQLLIIKSHLCNKLADPKDTVPAELLALCASMLDSEISSLQSVDYHVFSKKKGIEKKFEEFSDQLLPKLSAFLSMKDYLAIAVKTDQMENLKTLGHEGRITSSSPMTNVTLRKIDAKVNFFIPQVDLFLQEIDASCKQRYKWGLRKTAMLQNWNSTPYHGFEEFIKQ